MRGEKNDMRGGEEWRRRGEDEREGRGIGG